jgi:hypothetical protein
MVVQEKEIIAFERKNAFVHLRKRQFSGMRMGELSPSQAQSILRESRWGDTSQETGF